jgi:hypothetical protein
MGILQDISDELVYQQKQKAVAEIDVASKKRAAAAKAEQATADAEVASLAAATADLKKRLDSAEERERLRKGVNVAIDVAKDVLKRTKKGKRK